MHVFESWQSFTKRPDNRGLTVEQMRGKYLYELYLFEINTTTSTSAAAAAGAAGGGGGSATPAGPTLDSDAVAFLTAAGITDSTQTSAVNQLVVDMKAANIWTKMIAVYPFVGGTATTHKWNLKDPQDTNAAFRLVFSGGWTHSSTGALPNGTNAFANTYLDTQTIGLNTGSMSYYSRTNFLTNNINIDIGYLRPSPDSYTDLQIEGHVGYQMRWNNSSGGITTTITDSRGFFTGCRNSNILSQYRNGVLLNQGANIPNAIANIPFYLGASNFNGTATYFANRECAFASIGDGLTNTEAADFYTAVQAFNTTLSRQV